MAGASDGLVERLARELRGREDLHLVVLFGSRARGAAAPDSDVDLAVWAPGADLLEVAAGLSESLGMTVDVVSLAEPDIPLLAEIVAHGLVVHEGIPHAHARWRTRALLALELDLPWYARMRDGWLRRVAADGLGSW